MPGRNTTFAILSLVDYLINSIESNEITCGIFYTFLKHSTQLITIFSQEDYVDTGSEEQC